MHLSERVRAMKPSSTLAVTARLKALKAAGVDVIGFGAGEPDFDTPPHIREAAKVALDQGKTRYEPTSGTPAARTAIANYVNARFGYSVGAENVIVSCGGKHALYLAFMAVVDPGDEVLLPSPYWVSYPEQARLAGAVVKEIPTAAEHDFKMTPDQLEAAITPKTRVLVINSPSNPTGTMYTRTELAALGEVVARHPQVIVFSDDIYERLIYGSEPFANIAMACPAVADQTVTFNCLSKTYAMTGWRAGYTIASKEVVKAMDTLQGQMTSNITSFVLAAIPTALDSDQEGIEEMRRTFAERGAYMHQRLVAMPGLTCPRPTGAFYVFPEISAYVGRTSPGGRPITGAQALAEALLEEARVAVVPGEDFGSARNVRLSFATSMEDIRKGLDRVEAFLASLA